MHFKRCERHPFTDTCRKRAALRRKQQLEREALPSLADLVAEAQPSEVEVMKACAVQWLDHERRSRALRADRWREARRRLSVFSANERAVLRAAWDRAPYPADPLYLLDFLHGYSVGRFSLDRMPFDLVSRDPHGCRIGPRLFAADGDCHA